MERIELISYDIDKFDEFYNDVSEKGILISIMTLFDYNGNLNDFSYGTRKNFFDISNLIVSISYNLGSITNYELLLINIIQKNNDCEFVVEKNQLQNAVKFFRNIFYTKESLELDNVDSSEDILDYKSFRKDIIIFDEASHKKLLDSHKDESVEYCLLSQIATIENLLSYRVNVEKIQPDQNYLVDISNIFSNSVYESLFRIELLLVRLSQFNNIKFCVRLEYEDIIKHKLRPIFNKIEYRTNNLIKNKSDLNILTSNNRDEISEMFKKIRSEYFGHSKFINELEQKINSYILLSKLDRATIFSAFLCGKSGVGKTEIGRLLHKYISPNSTPIKLNFGNYTNKGSLWSLIGSPKGYIGSSEGGELTNKIKNSDSTVILIDEFDRADLDIFNFFYELLEDGSYTDLNGDVIDLRGYVIIFTSNLDQTNYLKVIPESLLSRIDMTVEFNELKEEQINEFINFTVDNLLNDYITYLNKADIELDEKEIENIKSELLKLESTGENNLRRLKRLILNKFSDLIED